jgi:hypothetical protein
MRAPANERLYRACEAKRRALGDYFWSLWVGKSDDVQRQLLQRAQDAEVEMNAALEPFIVRETKSI